VETREDDDVDDEEAVEGVWESGEGSGAGEREFRELGLGEGEFSLVSLSMA
jgi:hypothetical protein